MIIICPKCGKINEVKDRRHRRPFLSITCRHCGQGTTIPIGTTGPSAERIRCPACGYRQTGQEQDHCIKCHAPLYGQTARKEEKPTVPDRTVTRPPAQAKVIKFMVIGLILVVLLTLGILAGTLYVIKASAAYRTAESFILKSEEIRASVGTPLQFGLFPAGSVRTRQEGGTADFRIHVKGSKGETDVRITLKRENGRWKVLAAVFTDATGTRKRISGG